VPGGTFRVTVIVPLSVVVTVNVKYLISAVQPHKFPSTGIAVVVVSTAKDEREGREKVLHEVVSTTVVGETQVWLWDVGMEGVGDDGNGGVHVWEWGGGTIDAEEEEEEEGGVQVWSPPAAAFAWVVVVVNVVGILLSVIVIQTVERVVRTTVWVVAAEVGRTAVEVESSACSQGVEVLLLRSWGGM
jgi:hypothetical protein